MSHGSKASLADVAKLAGVSAQTVSRVANGSNAVRPQTRQRVLDAMAELGYRPSFAARSLRAGSYRCVGIAVSGSMAATERRIQLEGVGAAAAKEHFAMTVLQLPEEEATLREASRRLSSLPVDGQIMYLGSNPEDFLEFEPPVAIPTVIISAQRHPRCATIGNDQTECATSIVDYFVQRGHREIRFVGGPKESISNAGRLKGWEQAMHAHGLQAVEPLHGDWSADSGYELGTRLVQQDKTRTAIFASNDAIAVGLVCALLDAGLRVPQDVSVMGVDDSLVGIVPRLGLSTYRFDNTRVGSVSFDLATNPPAGSDPPHILLPGTIVERASVAPLA